MSEQAMAAQVASTIGGISEAATAVLLEDLETNRHRYMAMKPDKRARACAKFWSVFFQEAMAGVGFGAASNEGEKPEAEPDCPLCGAPHDRQNASGEFTVHGRQCPKCGALVADDMVEQIHARVAHDLVDCPGLDCMGECRGEQFAPGAVVVTCPACHRVAMAEDAMMVDAAENDGLAMACPECGVPHEVWGQAGMGGS